MSLIRPLSAVPFDCTVCRYSVHCQLCCVTVFRRGRLPTGGRRPAPSPAAGSWTLRSTRGPPVSERTADGTHPPLGPAARPATPLDHIPTSAAAGPNSDQRRCWAKSRPAPLLGQIPTSAASTSAARPAPILGQIPTSAASRSAARPAPPLLVDWPRHRPTDRVPAALATPVLVAVPLTGQTPDRHPTSPAVGDFSAISGIGARRHI